jgi:hypothetical protein
MSGARSGLHIEGDLHHSMQLTLQFHIRAKRGKDDLCREKTGHLGWRILAFGGE